MIEFAMETPTGYYRSMSSWSAFDFVMAHSVLADSAYAHLLQGRPRDRMLIMDNSMHELGEPLPIDKILDAAVRCRADYVVPPDKLDAPAWNVQQFARMHRQLTARGTVVAAVMCGEDSLDRLFALDNYVDKTSMILLPFRKPRLRWFLEHRDVILRFPRIHLLGVNTLEELGHFVAASAGTEAKWSVDTAKPLKWAVEGRKLCDLAEVRGAKLSSKDVLELKELTHEVKDLAYENVLFLRKICRGEA